MMTLACCDLLQYPSIAPAYSSGGREGIAIGTPGAVTSGPHLLVVVDRFPESNPDVEYSQAAAQTPDKTVCHECPQSRTSKQQVVVSPFRSPRQDDEKHSGDRAEKYEHQYDDAMKPQLSAGITICWGIRRGLQCGCGTGGSIRLCSQ